MAETKEIKAWVDAMNKEYCELHTTKEDAFWAAKMGTGGTQQEASDAFAAAEKKLQAWNQDPAHLEQCELHLSTAEAANVAPTDDMLVALKGWRYFFNGMVLRKQETRDMFNALLEKEQLLEVARSEMPLGYTAPKTGEHVTMSSVGLATMMKTDPDRDVRRAVWEGLRSVEPYVIDHGFIDVVKRRNAMARSAGFEDYYAFVVERVENMTKNDIFSILDELVKHTEDATKRAYDTLKKKQPDLQGFDVPFLIGGDIAKKLDPYFPFEKAISRWGQAFANMGIDYQKAVITVDLLDRDGKYSNGFCHAPEVAWVDNNATQRARVNFSSNGIPSMVGSGQRACNTVFHEAGHCAHFANIAMPAPCFAQEFLMSVAYAETQSMFLDSLLDDGDWLHLEAGVPVDLIKESIEAKQPYAALSIRSMLTIPYAERAIYEMPENELTPESVIATIRRVESELLCGFSSSRPVLSVPHLLSNESSAYYHSYLLAMIAVEQTRQHFIRRDGHLLNNSRIGPDLAAGYWKVGNQRTFAEHVQYLTGAGPDARPLADSVNMTAESKIAEAEASIKKGMEVREKKELVDEDEKVQLNAVYRVTDGGTVIAETEVFGVAAEEFVEYVVKRKKEEKEKKD